MHAVTMVRRIMLYPTFLKAAARLIGLFLAAGIFSYTSAKGIGTAALNIQEDFDLTTPGSSVAVVWSADGSALAAASNYGEVLTIWDRAGHLVNQIRRDGGGPTLEGSLAFIHGSSQLVFPPPETPDGNTAFAIWDVSTGKIVATVHGPQPEDKSALNSNAHFMTTPDQSLLATATFGNIIFYETGSWRVLHTATIQHGTSSLCVFAHGRLAAVGSLIGGQVSVLDLESGGVVEKFQAYEESKYGVVTLGAIAGSPAGDLIMVGISGGAINGGEYYGTPAQHAWEDATGSTDAVRLFRTKDGTHVATFPAAKGPIRQAMSDPKGRFVAFVDNHRGLFLWAPWVSADYKRIDLPSKTLSLAISPDGERIAVTTDKGVRIYSVQ